MRQSVEVQLLGPVRVLVDGADVDLGGPRPRAVVAVLALRPGRPLDAEGLARSVWGEAVPPSAPGTLRAYLSRMRARLSDGVLVRGADGWSLAVRPEQVDASRVTALVDRAAHGDPVARRPLLEEAVGLVRGVPLGGIGDGPVVARHRQRLVDLVADAEEALLELRLEAGEHREVIVPATALVHGHPHREGPARVLAVALARSGRYAEALAEVDALRTRLAEDLGLDLSPRTEELHRGLLLHDPAVLGPRRPDGAAVVHAPRAVPPGTSGTVDGADVGAVAPTESVAHPPLPLPLTSFVGRESDIRAVHDALGAARLVTLVGPGGSGKTRLALEALRRLGREDLDGPWTVELGYVDDASQVVDTVAQALSVSTAEAADVRAVADTIRGRRLLLVLDNCEHVVAEVADMVTRLLSSCGGLQVLATSREALGVAGERVHSLLPLRCGRPGRPDEAEELFAERAASAAPGFRLGASTAVPVNRLVRALDGIPLALELAAARLAVMGLDDILETLDDRFALLEGGARTALPRQRTLAAAVEWSHDLLDEDERRLFGVAGVFAGPFTLPALRGLADGELQRPVLGVLASLTAKSMVQVDRSEDLRESRSYRLLETMRVFARSRLSAEDTVTLGGRHLDWFVAEADRAYAQLRGPEARRWLAHLDLVRPDMRAALRWAVDRQDRASALRLVAGLAVYWFHRGHVQEGLGWVLAAQALPGVADDVTEARAVLGAALLGYARGDATRLDPVVLSGLGRAARTTADPSTAAVAGVYAGYFEAAFGDLGRAQEHFARSAELLGSGAVEPWASAEVLFAQGQLLRAHGRPLEALEVMRASADAAAACGHTWAAGSARYIAAKVHLDQRQGAPPSGSPRRPFRRASTSASTPRPWRCSTSPRPPSRWWSGTPRRRRCSARSTPGVSGWATTRRGWTPWTRSAIVRSSARPWSRRSSRRLVNGGGPSPWRPPCSGSWTSPS